jgi:acetyl esterase/lipase
MPVLRELEPLLEQVRAAGELDPSMPIAERRAQVHAGIDAQAAHMVPPTLIATVEYDLQRDDGERYAERLRAIHVPVTYVCWEGRLQRLARTHATGPPGQRLAAQRLLPPQAPSSASTFILTRPPSSSTSGASDHVVS